MPTRINIGQNPLLKAYHPRSPVRFEIAQNPCKHCLGTLARFKSPFPRRRAGKWFLNSAFWFPNSSKKSGDLWLCLVMFGHLWSSLGNTVGPRQNSFVWAAAPKSRSLPVGGEFENASAGFEHASQEPTPVNTPKQSLCPFIYVPLCICSYMQSGAAIRSGFLFRRQFFKKPVLLSRHGHMSTAIFKKNGRP